MKQAPERPYSPKCLVGVFSEDQKADPPEIRSTLWVCKYFTGSLFLEEAQNGREDRPTMDALEAD
jgi:hypothetical protein